MKNDKDNLIVPRTFDFALKVVAYCELLKAQKKFEMSHQLFESVTSVGANTLEAQNAESKADFIHKFKISLTKSDKTYYWLMLCNQAPTYPNLPIGLIEENNRIMSKIVSSSKK